MKHLAAMSPAAGTPGNAFSHSQAEQFPGYFPLTLQLSEMNPGLYESFLQVAVVMHSAIQWKSRHTFFLLLQQLLREPSDEVRQEEL